MKTIQNKEIYEINILSDKYTINNLDNTKKLEIMRTNKIKVNYNPINNSMKFNINKNENTSIKCYGILGIFKSIKTDYLILISNVEIIGDIFDSKIYKIKKVKN